MSYHSELCQCYDCKCYRKSNFYENEVVDYKEMNYISQFVDSYNKPKIYKLFLIYKFRLSIIHKNVMCMFYWKKDSKFKILKNYLRYFYFRYKEWEKDNFIVIKHKIDYINEEYKKIPKWF